MNPAPHNTLFIWDFDNTIVLDNTDTLVFSKLAPDILQTLRPLVHPLGSTPPPLWTDLVASGLRALFHRGISSDTILSAVAQAPLPAQTRTALLAVAKCPYACSGILSDANSLFISACLSRNNIDEAFTFTAGVVTNPAYVDNSGCVRVAPYLKGDVPERRHSCHTCPRNLCKGEVLDKMLRSDYKGWRLVYVGDGGNDFCPVRRMGENCVTLVREGHSLHRKVVEGGVRAQVRLWKTADELRVMVDELLRGGSVESESRTQRR